MVVYFTSKYKQHNVILIQNIENSVAKTIFSLELHVFLAVIDLELWKILTAFFSLKFLMLLLLIVVYFFTITFFF